MNVSVSVLMPCFNAAGHLARSVTSLQQQTFADWELVAVDDGSGDSTWHVLAQMAAADGRIRPIRQQNGGAAAARNRALAAASGRYVAFLDSDDTWSPEFLNAMVGALETHPDAGIAYCGWQNIGLGGARDQPYVPPDYETGDKIRTVLRSCPWPIHGALVRAGLIHDAGGFDEGLSSCMDFDLWLRLGSTHTLVRVPRVMAYYHHDGGAQITGNRARIALNHLRVQKKFLASNPDVARSLGKVEVRTLTIGELLHRGYLAYWERDMPAARAIFRVVMQHTYGRPKDWLYMLPAWLPAVWHQRLLALRDDRVARTAAGR